MELMSVLEKKVEELLERGKELASRNAYLAEESQNLRTQNDGLQHKIDDLEHNLASIQQELTTIKNSSAVHSNELNELHQEKAITKLIIEDLIKNIESSSSGGQLL